MTAKYNQKKRLLTVICKVVLATRDVTMTPSINVLKESMATDCGKMCTYAAVLQGMFKLGGIELFGRSLEEHLGGMSNDAVAGLYAEHEMAADSDSEFTAPNHPAAGTTTPRQEFRVVVGKHAVDTEKWSLNPTAEPTCGADARVPGRVVRPIAHYMRCEQVRRATLTQGEVIALRLFTGPMSAKYNKVLRETTLRESAAQADAGLEAQVAVEGTTDLEVNTYSTTIGLIISGILKLGRIATAPRRNSQGTALAYRGLDGLDLPPALSTPDAQGFCGGSGDGVPVPVRRRGSGRRVQWGGARQGGHHFRAGAEQRIARRRGGVAVAIPQGSGAPPAAVDALAGRRATQATG